ncbi:MAG TPA: hypothetical protein VFR10_06715 [bacterium]|nr:hypothetical protein [bacterium]
MFAFDRKCVVIAIALLLGIAFSASAEPQPHNGRVAILQNEAERLATTSPPFTIGGAAAVGAALGAGLLAYLGTYLGIRRFSFGRMREKDGWREVSYRFRSSPLAIKSDTLARMTNLLEDLEQRGAELRAVNVPQFMRRESSPDVPAEAPPVSVAPPVPVADPPRIVSQAPSRDAGYRRARTLLDQGFDLETVRAMTGLKRAEIDLVRCAPPQPATAS